MALAHRTRLLAGLGALALAATACSGDDDTEQAEGAPPAAPPAATSAAPPSQSAPAAFADETLEITAIPDQDPEDLARRYDTVSEYLSDKLGVQVTYKPVTDYSASVTAFRRGDVDAAFFGGLSGVQARLQLEGSKVLAQRDIDEMFTSVFIAPASAGIEPFTEVAGLSALKGKSLTFGSETSTSGRLMPSFFLAEAGVPLSDLAGDPGFSGSHDATIKLVQAGSFEVGALNSQVWDDRVADGTVDPAEVVELFRTPPYNDYHWLANPDLDEKFGAGFTEALTTALLELDGDTPEEVTVLDLFSAGAFVPADESDLADIEAVGRQLKLIN